jgi:hypothetical protein
MHSLSPDLDLEVVEVTGSGAGGGGGWWRSHDLEVEVVEGAVAGHVRPLPAPRERKH